MKFIVRLLALVFFCPFSSALAQNCSDPAGVEGEIVYNSTYNVPQYCNGLNWVGFAEVNAAAGGTGSCTNPNKDEGTIVYNTTYSVLQFCDGADWRAVGNGMCASVSRKGPAGCPEIGDKCADNTIFAGWHPITFAPLYIPPTDQGANQRWKTSTGTNDIAIDSISDGRANTNQVPNSATFPAFKLCKDLTFGGHNDWYLPSQVEIFYLWSIRSLIAAKGNITNYQNTDYWSSTENSTTLAWYHDFTSGDQYNTTKTDPYRVRCVRR